MPDIEQEIFDAASAKDDFTTETVGTAPNPGPVVEPNETPDGGDGVIEPSGADGQDEDRRSGGGDLNKALRQERENIKRIRAELEEERQERRRLMTMFERNSQPNQPTKPEPEIKAPDFWEDPNAWINQQLESREKTYADQMFQTREHFSRALAIQIHGEERVKTAWQALEDEINAGRLDPKATVEALRASQDPYGDILRWHDSRPEVQERTMRERIEAELREKYGLGDPANPAPPAPPANRTLPSVNRANGNAGAPQGGSITEEDIFQAAPAFRGRK